MKKPNFLIIGTQKGGTEWLYHTLKEHEKIFLPNRIELSHFSQKDCFQKLNIENYFKNFENLEQHVKCIGENTSSYFWTYSENREYCVQGGTHNQSIPKNVHEQLGKDTKLITSLQHPVMRAIESFFHHVQQSRIEDNKSISDYYKNKMGIIDIGFYSEHLEEWKKYFNRKNFLVLIMERDIIKNPNEGMNKVLSFLELSPLQMKNTNRKNIFNKVEKWESGIISLNTLNSPFITGAEIKFLINLYQEDMNKLRKILNDSLDEWKEIDKKLLSFSSEYIKGTLAVDSIEIKNNVLFGKNDYLFLHQGAQKQFDFLLQNFNVSSSSINNFFYNIENRVNYSKMNKIKYLHIVFASKPLVKYLHLPKKYSKIYSLFNSYYRKNNKNLDSILYTLNLLEDAESNYSTFYKHDTHMLDRGYLLVIKKLFNMLEISFDEKINKSFEYKQKRGDLLNMLREKKITKEEFLVLPKCYIVGNRSTLKSNSDEVVIAYNPKGRQRILIFGDSFLKDTINIIAHHFKDVMYIRSPFVHYDIVKMFQPDVLISGNAERYLSNVSSEKDSNNFLMSKYGNQEFIPEKEYLDAFLAQISYAFYPHIYNKWEENLKLKGD